MRRYRGTLAALLMVLVQLTVLGEVKVTVERNQEPTPQFVFKTIPAPLRNDLAAVGKFTILEGASDPNGGGVQALNDGLLPNEDDQPDRNFFFNAGEDGGRLQLDLGSVVEIKQVNSYSWHPSDRGPQVYKLFASDGSDPGFNPLPRRVNAPEQCGWRFLAAVDTRPQAGEPGGQYGLSIFNATGTLGKYRYLLFDISRTENRDPFGNTFYSEIDVRGAEPAEPEVAAAPKLADGSFRIRSVDQYCEISINTIEAPDLKEWAEQKLAPVLAQWYPKIVSLLPSEGYSAPKKFSVNIRPGNGVAATGRGIITANATWLKRELEREALGALLHEEVHVVQQYRAGRRDNPDFKRPPGWLVEGIPDYIRWFLYEPQSHGADAPFFRTRKNLTLSYDGRYRVSANFLNYVIQNYGKEHDLLARVNAACRQGIYTDDLWKELTGKSLPQLNEEWNAALQKEIGQQQ